MDNFFVNDKFTESNNIFYEKNQPKSNLSDEKKSMINALHEDCKNELMTFFEHFNFNQKDEVRSEKNFRISRDLQDDILNGCLIKIQQKDRQRKLGNESPYEWFRNDENEVRYSVEQLDQELKEEQFFTNPIDWLILKGIILPSKCSNCLADHKSYSDKNGEYYWECNNDRDCSPKLMELGNCFNFCNKIIKHLPAIIYNWSIYGNVGVLTKSLDTNLDLESNKIRLAIESIRKICQKTNEHYTGKLGEDGKKVELFTFLCSEQLTLFAFETDTTKLKFKLIDANNFDLIVSYLIEWFDPSAHIVIYDKKFNFLVNYKIYFKKIEHCKLDGKTNKFMCLILPLIARHVIHGCENKELFTRMLHETIWRIKFGQTPYSSFLFIVSLIQNYINSNKNGNRISSRLLLVDANKDRVLLDVLYYGRFDQVNESNINLIAELRCNIRCHLCFVPFNFQTIFNHILEHLCLGLKLRKVGDCNHCFKKMTYYETQLHRDLLDGKYKKDGLITSKTSCKICCISFKKGKELIEHMKEYHVYQDQPYSCSYCPFRTSFYHELVQHFKSNHSDLIKACCKFCLKLFVTDDSSEQLYDHMKNHLEKKDSFKCLNCSLTFVDYDEFKSHFLKDHIIQSKSAFNFTVIEMKPQLDACLELKVDVKAPKMIKKRSSDGVEFSVEERKTTKKGKLKLRYEELRYDALLNKSYIIIRGEPVICMECAQFMDTNHLSKLEMRCVDCNYKSFCSRALDYPCGLHFATVVD